MNASLRSSAKFTFVLIAALGAACSGGGAAAGGGSGTPVSLTYSPHPSGYPVGFPLELAPIAGGSPTAYWIVAGVLPPGVTFNTSTGAFGGRPLLAGSAEVVVRASNGGPVDEFAVTLQIVPPPAARFLFVAETDADLLTAFLVDDDSGAARHVGMAATGDEPSVVAVAPGSTHVAVGSKSSGLSIFAIHPVYGRPQEVPGSPVALGSEVLDLVFHPDGTHLYALVASGSANDLIVQFEFDESSGALVPLTPPAVSVPDHSTALAVDPLGRALYLAHGAAVRSFTIQPGGGLSSAGDRIGGSLPIDVSAVPDGSAVFALNSGSKDLWRFSTGPDGALQAGVQAVGVIATMPFTLAVTGDGDFLYVGDGVGGVELFRRKANGSLAPLDPPSVALDGDLRGLAADPSGAGAWVTLGARNELVSLPSVTKGGVLAPDLETPVRTHGLPTGIVAAPGRKAAVVRATSLYAVNWEDDDFNQFAVADDGTLSALTPAVEPTGTNPENVVAHPFHDALYVSNSNDSLQAVEAFRVDSEGAASPLQPFAALKGSHSLLIGLNGDLGHVILPDAVAPVSISSDGKLAATGAPPMEAISTGRAVRHPGGTAIYLPDGSLGSVFNYSIDLEDGSLTNIGGLSADLGTNDLALEPTGRFLYAVNDADGVDRVRGWAIDANSGRLHELATSPFALPDQALDSISVVAHPSGRVLYVATRGNAAVAGQGAIHAFTIETDPDSGPALGGLTPLGLPAILAGQQPHDLAVAPDGATLYVSIEAAAGSVLVYRLDAAGEISIDPIDSEITGARTRGLSLRTHIE